MAGAPSSTGRSSPPGPSTSGRSIWSAGRRPRSPRSRTASFRRSCCPERRASPTPPLGDAARDSSDAISRGGETTPLLESAFNKREVRFSPDGQFLAMISNESGRPEVYVTSFPGPGERVRVSAGGARHLRWSRDGREIFYISSDQYLVSVPVRTSPTLELGSATLLFQLREGGTDTGALDRGISSGFDVSADGKRFLVVFPEIVGDALPLTVVANWESEAGTH